MIVRTVIRNRPLLPALIVILVSAHLALDYSRGGIPAHHLLADPDLPAISNWWGLLLLPLVAWIVVSRVYRRIRLLPKGEMPAAEKKAGRRFLGGLVFGILIAVLWETGHDAILPGIILLPVALSLFIPVYRAEYYLGFVLAMAYTFGGVLPVVIGLVLLFLCWIVHDLLRGGVRRLVNK